MLTGVIGWRFLHCPGDVVSLGHARIHRVARGFGEVRRDKDGRPVLPYCVSLGGLMLAGRFGVAGLRSGTSQGAEAFRRRGGSPHDNLT